MAHRAATAMRADFIPVIDIGPLRDGSDPGAVGRALHEASREAGFLYVRNHGLDADALGDARAEALAFFRAPAETKDAVRVSGAHRGWLAAGGATMDKRVRPDLKESFIWGYEDAEGDTPRDHPLRGANRWPQDRPAFRAAATRWFEGAHALAAHLMRGFALGLDLPEDFFLRSCERPLSRASFVYYPPQPDSAGADQFGVGPHTDFGVLTVLGQDDIGGLQVQDPAGRWVAAPPIADTLVVNVGDLLARWTNDAYRSTPHRVVNASGRERLSLVLAFDPEPQTMIDPRAVFGEALQTPHEPITCGDYLEQRFARAFAYRNG